MKKGRVMTYTGLLLIAAALCLVGLNLRDNAHAGSAARQTLEELVPQIRESVPVPDPAEIVDPEETEYPDYLLHPGMEMPVREINGFEYVGVVSIPVLELELPVMSEWSYAGLKEAPCRYVGTPYLDNMVIAAHNFEWHFGRIHELVCGDEVIFTDMDGNVFRYTVAEIEKLSPLAVEEMTESYWPLTLFTCTVGGRLRVTVRCQQA